MVALLLGLLLLSIPLAVPVAAKTVVDPPRARAVVVQQDQTLWEIARAAAPNQDPSQTIVEILELNEWQSVELIHPGDTVLVPAADAP